MDLLLETRERRCIIPIINNIIGGLDMPSKEKKPLIQVMERAFDILDILAESEEPVRASDIAARIGTTTQTAGNLLRSLYGRGMVSQDSERRYRLGPHCFFLGSFADRWRKLRENSQPILRQLRDATGDIVFIGVIENDKLYCLSMLNPSDEYFSYPRQLWAEQLHSTACGRLLMALMPGEERGKLLKRIKRRQLTEKTVTEVARLEKLCAEISESGYSEVIDESVKGTWSLAVPVLTPAGKLLAGLAIAGPAAEYSSVPRGKRLDLLFEAASKIGRTNLKE